MKTLYYIGLDIHKKVIAYCIKAIDGRLVRAGMIEASRKALDEWVRGLPGPWIGAMEATIFTGWIYDNLIQHAVELKVAHPEMLKAITAAKKKNDRDDAERIADLLRVNLLPECYMLPSEIRELRRILRYRNHIVRTAVKMQNKMCGLLLEVGADYNKTRLRGKRYFTRLLETVEEIPQSVKELLKLSRAGFEMFHATQKQLVKALRTNSLIQDRVRRLMTIRGIGEVTALTWVLEIGEPSRFDSIRQAISYCGLCSAQRDPFCFFYVSHRFCGFHLGAVPDLPGIPGDEPDIDPFSGQGIDHLVAAFFQADGAVEVDCGVSSGITARYRRFPGWFGRRFGD
jgi:transposase